MLISTLFNGNINTSNVRIVIDNKELIMKWFDYISASFGVALHKDFYVAYFRMLYVKIIVVRTTETISQKQSRNNKEINNNKKMNINLTLFVIDVISTSTRHREQISLCNKNKKTRLYLVFFLLIKISIMWLSI